MNGTIKTYTNTEGTARKLRMKWIKNGQIYDSLILIMMNSKRMFDMQHAVAQRAASLQMVTAVTALCVRQQSRSACHVPPSRCHSAVTMKLNREQ